MSSSPTSYAAVTTPLDVKINAVPTTIRKRVLHIAVNESSNQHGGPRTPSGAPHFLYQGQDGTHEAIEVPADELVAIRDKLEQPKSLLGQWMATAVCGNDVMSSCSYSSGVVALQAGVASPAAFVVVSLVLYVYRFVYEEVVTAIPLNGGSYNVLLNTTSKRFAAVAACLSILCYMATAVVSATTAVNYLTVTVPETPLVETTIGLLAAFALLMIIGIKESAVVATGIFGLHMITLSILVVVCLVFTVKIATIQHPEIIKNNYTNVTYPDVDFMGTQIQGSLGSALFFGFGAAVLGVTGFETSSNFVEEQQPGVFRKTMRNMWSISSFFNISLAVLCFGVLRMDGDDGIKANQHNVLAQMGLVAAGKWAQWLVVVDSFIVLSGAVLTAYVGINGLMRRLGSDRVVPVFFVSTNKWRGTCHWIVLVFFAVSTSLVLVLKADQTVVAGVYTYSFLALMFLFGSGCIMLKLKRQDIPRDISAPWWYCGVGMTLVACGFLANLLGNPQTLMYFVSYLIMTLVVVFASLEQVFLLRVLVVLTNLVRKHPQNHDTPQSDDNVEVPPDVAAKQRPSSTPLENENANVSGLVSAIKAIQSAPVVFFVKDADLTTLNKAILYVRANELTHNLRFIHVYPAATVDALEVVDQLKDMIAMFDRVYPKIQYVLVKAVSTHGVRVITG
ncbi:hypothetical protein DYB26_006018 [Aphanomyces astaci]|uniref:Amino acid permease/ SLC12A domain-containing protein n=2 Tax=Aphanomyces astaci TaxID=112090 RepID=A0A397CUZ6_APHAT|nr:hypothetical protein DYB38_005510 [Aphanomyces astaci]RHZ27381.1 hypothetical protein DYB26_006018 [Aphanomyces astaci]